MNCIDAPVYNRVFQLPENGWVIALGFEPADKCDLASELVDQIGRDLRSGKC